MGKKIFTTYERQMFFFVHFRTDNCASVVYCQACAHTFNIQMHILYTSIQRHQSGWFYSLLCKCIIHNTFLNFTVAIVTSPVTCPEMLHWSNSSHGSFYTGWWGVPRQEASYSHIPQTYIWSWRTLQLSETLSRRRNKRYWKFIGMLRNIFVI